MIHFATILIPVIHAAILCIMITFLAYAESMPRFVLPAGNSLFTKGLAAHISVRSTG